MWGGTDEQMALRTIRAALEHGINLIDTAPVYGQGALKNSWVEPSRNMESGKTSSLRPRSGWSGAEIRCFATRLERGS